jgi:hypothetical protein
MKNTNHGSARTRMVVAAIINIAIVLLELSALVSDFVTHNTTALEYYTNDSNYLACIACFVCAVFELKQLCSAKGTDGALPYAVKVLKYLATCCLMLTFTVVLTILVPAWSSTGVNGFKMMFGPYQLFARHLVCPWLSFVSFVFFEKEPVLTKKVILFGELPTLLYAGVTIVLNALYLIDGPYPFLRVHNQSIFMSLVWGVVVIGFSFVISYIILICNRKSV